MYMLILIAIALVVVIVYALFFEDKTDYLRYKEGGEVEKKVEPQYRVKQVTTDGKSEWFPQINEGEKWIGYMDYEEGPFGCFRRFKSKKKALDFIAEMSHIPKIEEKIHYA